MRSREQSWPASKREAVTLPPLPLTFYLRDTARVAHELLGKGLYVRQGSRELLAEIVEVEGYLRDDPASHSFRGPSSRNVSMFAGGGTCYVYLIYGVHWCMNVVTGAKGSGEAVLLRAAVPAIGLPQMRKRRGIDGDRNLMNGPGKLCQALGIDLDYDGARFDREDFKLVDLGTVIRENEIGCSSRIGISKATDKLLRFFIKGSPWLSRKG